jgi:hypothetical protein
MLKLSDSCLGERYNEIVELYYLKIDEQNRTEHLQKRNQLFEIYIEKILKKILKKKN